MQQVRDDIKEELKDDLTAVLICLESAIRRQQEESLSMLKASIESGDTMAIAFDSKYVARTEDDRRRVKRCSAQLLQLINRYFY